MEQTANKKKLVQQYLKSGLTYRKVADIMGFKSTSAVHHYAKGVHQHRLSKFKNEYWFCTKCSMKFYEGGE